MQEFTISIETLHAIVEMAFSKGYNSAIKNKDKPSLDITNLDFIEVFDRVKQHAISSTIALDIIKHS